MVQYASQPRKTIIDIVDAPSLQIKRALRHENFLWKLIWSIELPRIRKYEKKICKQFRTVLVASKADKFALGKGIILKNSTKINKIKRQDSPKNNIMFLGNMEYAPNVDGVMYFIEEIFPLIKKEINDTKFYIVGKNPKKTRKLANRDVIVTGFVKNLEEVFSKCSVFVAPLRLGSGIQNKVLEALNYEIPIVTTAIVNNGIEAKPGGEILVANKPKDFAKKIVILLKNDKLRKQLSNNGKKFLRKHYSPSNINKQLDRIIEKHEFYN
jgi:glycosyltransferase involved in cell wall biosynthesis